jgi:hypothetical protein
MQKKSLSWIETVVRTAKEELLTLEEAATDAVGHWSKHSKSCFDLARTPTTGAIAVISVVAAWREQLQ